MIENKERKNFSFRKLYCNIPEPLYDRVTERRLWREIDNIVTALLEEYLDGLDRGDGNGRA